MSDTVANTLITGSFTFASATLVWWGLRHQIKEVHKDINGRMSQLVVAEKNVSHQEGMAEQKQITKDEAKAP